MSSDILLLRSEVAASREEVKAVLAAVAALRADIAQIKEANRSSSSSGTKFGCPLGCGAEFQKVCQCEWSCRTYTHALQVTYLQDHLHRSCRISQRKMCCQTQACRFDASIPSHSALWRQVFPSGEIVNDENVGFPCHTARAHALSPYLITLSRRNAIGAR
jgi:hypothetical protein